QHQTALRGPAAVSIREGDGRGSPATPQKPLRADGPAIQNGELNPRRVTVTGRRHAEGIETLVRSGRLLGTASAQFVCTRSSGCIGWAVAAGGWYRKSGHRRGGQSKRNGVGHMPP